MKCLYNDKHSIHKNATLSATQKKEVMDWINNIKDSISSQIKNNGRKISTFLTTKWSRRESRFQTCLFAWELVHNKIPLTPFLFIRKSSHCIYGVDGKKPTSYRSTSNISLSFNLQGIPKVKNIRGALMFGWFCSHHF